MSQNENINNTIFKVLSVIRNVKSQEKNEHDLLAFYETLTSETEMCRLNEQKTQENLNKLLQSENLSSTSKYISIKQENEKLRNEVVSLRNQLETAVLGFAAEKESMKIQKEKAQAEIEDKYKLEVHILQHKLSENQTKHEIDISRLYNELHLAQSTAAFKCDELETDLKRKICDANNKLRDSQNTCMSLKKEISSLKAQMYANQNNQQVSSKTLEFEDRSRTSLSNFTNMNTTNSSDNNNNPPSNAPLKTKTNMQLKYQQLNVVSDKNRYSLDEFEIIDDDFDEDDNFGLDLDDAPNRTPQTVFAPQLYKGRSSFGSKKNIVPPLKSCTVANVSKPIPQKKRKLYNPDIDYVNDV